MNLSVTRIERVRPSLAFTSMVTDQAMPEDLRRFEQAGAHGVVTKSVSLDQLCRGLREVRPVH